MNALPETVRSPIIIGQPASGAYDVFCGYRPIRGDPWVYYNAIGYISGNYDEYQNDLLSFLEMPLLLSN
jgi:hypothetical protein